MATEQQIYRLLFLHLMVDIHRQQRQIPFHHALPVLFNLELDHLIQNHPTHHRNNFIYFLLL